MASAAIHFCPRCSKSFRTETNLLQHMNQPVSSCLAHYQEALAIREALLQKRKRKHSTAFPSANEGVRSAGLTRNERMAAMPNSEPWSGPFHEAPEVKDTEAFSSVEPPFGTQPPPPPPEHPTQPVRDAQRSEGEHGASSRPLPSSFIFQRHPTGGAIICDQGKTFMDAFNEDGFAEERGMDGGGYYPFASRPEWELAAFLACSGLSKQKLNELLALQLMRSLKLSFNTAADLFNRLEILPKAPAWKSRQCPTEAPTKQKSNTLFYRDPIDCLQSLLHQPLIKDHIQYTPFKIFDQAKGMMRVYTEWLSGDRAWEMQDSIPFSGATVLGTVLSSDKTTISQMTGNKTAYPLLISLANIDMDFRMKGSNHAFMLLALLPTPTFLHQSDRVVGMLGNRFTHECLSFVLEPLKIAARIGVMLSDALGKLRFCYTPLAAYIVDTPESTMIAGVGRGASSVTTALQENFGDSMKHPPRTREFTWQTLEVIRTQADPSDVVAYHKASTDLKYNGVHSLFWMDWPLSDPSIFLTPEPLHHWNKGFWDHDAKWCIHVLGAPEIDFRFSVLQPRTGFRHFKEGISKLKQVTGREHRDVERYIVAVICGAVPRRFLLAVRSLMDFRYLGQSTVLDDEALLAIDAALRGFHDNKQAVLDTGARDNKKGVQKKWAAPKFEFLQSVTWNIRRNGVALQWSADRTERAHIDVIKNPSDNTNNQKYESQIVRHLDRLEKCRVFDLGTSMRDANITFRGVSSDIDSLQASFREGEGPVPEPTTNELLGEINPVATLSSGGTRPHTDYFAKAEFIKQTSPPLMLVEGIKTPQRTFSEKETAFHLNLKPDFKRLSIAEAAARFDIPDLKEALIDYAARARQSESDFVHTIGGRRGAVSGATLPFSDLAVWKSVRIQNRAYHYPHVTLKSQTINASPPDIGANSSSTETWNHGRFDAVIANFDPEFNWPHSGLPGHQVVDIRLIFCAVPPNGSEPPSPFDQFLTYARRYDIVPQSNPGVCGTMRKGIYPEPDSSLFLLRRAKRANESVIGDILPLRQVRTLVDLIPNFGSKANSRLTSTNSFHYCSEYWLNKYFDKELYLALSSA